MSRRAAAAAIVAMAVVGAGCSEESTTVSTATPSTTTTPSTSTFAPKTSIPSTAITPTSSGSDTSSAWSLTAVQYRGQNGKRFTIACTPNGTESSVWGTDTYTDDSHVCTAAVQVGLITFAAGGNVEIEIAPGAASYQGGTANEVTSSSYGSWEGSFTFPAVPKGSVQFTVGAESWGRNARQYHGQDGKRFAVQCAPNGVAGSVWGSGPYTDDSSVCTAAVHSGLITLAQGGQAVIEIAPGQGAYKGSTANGVTTSDYGQYDGSFTFPAEQTTK